MRYKVACNISVGIVMLASAIQLFVVPTHASVYATGLCIVTGVCLAFILANPHQAHLA